MTEEEKICFDLTGVPPEEFIWDSINGVFWHSSLDGRKDGCGHFHDPEDECPERPCGSYLCCIN